MARSSAFRLETLLHLRRLREQERQRAVATRLSAIHRLEERQSLLLRRIDEQAQSARSALRGGSVDLDQLRLGRHWLMRLRRGVLETQAEISAHRALLAEERRQLVAAATDKKVLDRLKETRLARIAQAREARERREQDEMNMLRYVHERLPAEGIES